MKQIIPRWFSRAWFCAGMSLVTVLTVKASTDVEFQVDVGSATPSAVYIRGSFNGWGTGNPLINTYGSVWSNTVTIADAAGTVESCKFYYDPGANWESINNRQFLLSASSPQILPLQNWNVNTWPQPTNLVTFQIDLTPEVITGGFTNGDPNGKITVSGDFEGWDNGKVLTNNPTTGDYTSNYYTGTFPVIGFPGGTTINYKFRMNGGWENPSSTGGNNRQAAINNTTLISGEGNGTFGPNVLPLVYYNDNTFFDLTQPIDVKFSVIVTNGEPDRDNVPFIKGTTTVWINGDWLGWWAWNGGAGGGAPAVCELKESEIPDVYTNTLRIPGGNGLALTYKYSMDQYDDENGFATNHMRLIRGYPPTFNMPLDRFSWSVLQPGLEPYPNPGITSTNIQEPNWGLLAIGAPAAGNFPITWLGRPGVVLEDSPNVTGGNWNINALTDSAQSYSWPNTGSQRFFRLMLKNPAPGSNPNTWF
ncbi:MAG TPA: hypothetical protein VMB80_05315 [Candidatus Acidoferrum sp.]|nr:hypothetical protein [Candidatus Acidoferrum sp.]